MLIIFFCVAATLFTFFNSFAEVNKIIINSNSNVFSNYISIPIGKWQDHFDYTYVSAVYKFNEKYYCITPKGILIVDKDGNLDKLSKINGLSDVNITASACYQNKSIIIGYKNGNIDVINSKSVINLNQYLKKNLNVNKTINSIKIFGNYAYLASGIGIIKLNLENFNLEENYILGENSTYLEIIDLAFARDSIFAITEKYILAASINQNLLDLNNWKIKTIPTTVEKFLRINGLNQNIYFTVKTPNTVIFYLQTPNTLKSLASIIPQESNICINSNKVYLTIWNSIIEFDENGTKIREIKNPGYPDFVPTCITFDNDKILIGTKKNGLVEVSENYSQNYYWRGTINSEVKKVSAINNHVIATRGGVFGLVNKWYTAGFSIFKNNQWINKQILTERNFECVFVDTNDISHFYIGSYGYGVFEFRDTNLINKFDWTNSPLETLIENQPYVRVTAISIDKNKNVWILSHAYSNILNVLMPDGEWQSFNNNIASITETGELAIIDNTIIGTITKKGLFFLNHNGTIKDKSDDNWRIYYPTTSDGERIGNMINTIAIDKNNYLWIGSDQGVAVIYRPLEFNSSNFFAERIKITDLINDSLQTSYLLETENITCIKIDGGNRKWIGTENSGVYLINENGSKQILNFNISNSPLPSNSITDIAIDHSTGIVYFATTEGLVSYRAEATASTNKFGKVYAFPNPVLPNFEGIVTITNLAYNSSVKITDIAGNLVYETKSIGGQATWNCRNFNGQKVASGIYLVFCSNEDGTESAVTKILILK